MVRAELTASLKNLLKIPIRDHTNVSPPDNMTAIQIIGHSCVFKDMTLPYPH